ncbi:NlpC/P60 family protein [Mycobacterium sp. CBMA293]|nr:NlpC/P60 family protein [Mycolicibacterium sp. CBMA 360]MUL62176.1 NlpC/P60 family protein [Mycolicibacterium sp. CBMA 335]MUL71637.1 NlpC/P60 family protein [Mycolicibacterium sp. CBMA 311]MUL93592.1 NlpC/P60 family protein [Mycolicibacterium sp. CBMA 230]MUM10478.1 NlpC/P60 family protein [Mycolicibacterium sp. CBMA 293]
MALVSQVSGTPYITGGDTPHGTDCSGLASWVANAASGRPVYGNRFNTGNEEAALRARGFLPGSAPGALNIGWNGGHTAVTLPDGTPVSSGESGGGVRIGGGGAFQRQFTHHMHLPMAVGDDVPADLPLDGPQDAPLAAPAGPADIPAPDIAPPPPVIEAAHFAPAPDAPAPAPEAPAPAPEGPEMPS